jgi:hypothetical protein
VLGQAVVVEIEVDSGAGAREVETIADHVDQYGAALAGADHRVPVTAVLLPATRLRETKLST